MKSILFAGCFLLFFWKAQTQSFPSFFQRLTPEQGLSQAVNSFVFRDSRGFVWVSSIDGLNRYDGHAVRVYRPSLVDSHAMVGKNMQSHFFETPNGDLWFCTYEAIHCYRRRTDDFEVYRIRNASGNVIENGYYIFHFDRASRRIWLRAGDGLYGFDTQTQRQSPCKGRLTGVRCFADTTTSGRLRGIWSSFFADSTGIRYILLDDTAGVASVQSFFTPKNRKMPLLGVSDIWKESDTLLWLASRQGLVAFNPIRLNFNIYQPKGRKKIPFWSVLPVGNQEIALSSPSEGLWLFDPIKRVFTRQILPEPDNPRSLPDREVEEMYRDADDHIWLSHWNTGLSHAHLHKQKFEHLRLKSLFLDIRDQPFEITGLVETEGAVWCATEGAGILVLKNGRPAGHFLSNQQVIYLIHDRAGNWWALTRAGVFWRDAIGGDFKKISKRGGLVFGLETADRLLFSGDGGVFEVQKGPHGKPLIAPAQGFEHWKNVFVEWMYQDQNETFYLAQDATTLGVFARDGSLREFPFGYTKAAYEDPDGRSIWLATTSGLARMDKTAFTYSMLNEAGGLPSQYLYSVIPDSQNNLWLSTNRGIVRYTPGTGKIRAYGRSDGVWADEFYTHAWLRTDAGDIWMGNRDVINVFRPTAVRDVQTLPNIQVTQLKVNDLEWSDSVYIGERMGFEFPYAANTLSFDFVALEYSDPANNRLRYMLEGYDQKWVELPPGAPGFARYAQLPPGQYTLKIMAANSDGIWNPAPRSLSIHIGAPYWQTWWFWLLTAAALFAAGYGFYRYRLAQVRAAFALRQQAQESELRAKGNALRAAGSEMKALRAQMNPHFIFNSLNSINAYILRNLPAEASGYLTEFAHLMRQILDNSARETIPLEQEIAFLESYLKTESLRLENKLTYHIRVADSVDTFETEIPSMILQPYVENAIWHGISAKPDGGHVLVGMERAPDGALLLSVEDNGVGREQGRALRAQRGGTRESKGLKITEERLALYDQKHKTKSLVKTIDLRGEQGEPIGTRVEIWIEYHTHQT